MIKRFWGGVHPPDRKSQTENIEIENFLEFDYVFIPFRQHIGEETVPCIKVGDYVKAGQVIAKSENSPWVHSSVSGNVEKIEKRLNRTGHHTEGALIKNDRRYKHINYHKKKKTENITKKEFLKIIQEAGIAGMGGGMFPTYKKLKFPENKNIEYFIVNGVECEPYLNADNRVMLEQSESLLEGIKFIQNLYKIPKVIIAVEDNKIKAITEIKKRTKGDHSIRVEKLDTRYPQGGEKQVLQTIFGKELPGLPVENGMVVLNVATCVAIYEAVFFEKPLIERVVTIAGDAVSKAKNLRVKLGTSMKDILDYCGVDRNKVYKLILGGPMMGCAVSNEKEVVIKGSNGVLALSEKEIKPYKSRECISCGKCLDVCPMGLVPLKYVELLKNNKIEDMEIYELKKCIRCGSCQYICPVNQPMMEAIWYGFSIK